MGDGLEAAFGVPKAGSESVTPSPEALETHPEFLECLVPAFGVPKEMSDPADFARGVPKEIRESAFEPPPRQPPRWLVEAVVTVTACAAAACKGAATFEGTMGENLPFLLRLDGSKVLSCGWQ